MRIAFLIGSPDISGGSYVIFQHVSGAISAGHSVCVITTEKVTDERLKWYPGASSFTWMSYEEARSQTFEIAIATWWKTVYELHHVRADRYVYFVQSIESKFYDGAEKPLRQLVDATYTLPFYFITEASWIQKYLWDNYGKDAFLVRNGIRKDIYNREGSCREAKTPGKLRVLVEGTIDAPFKNVPKTIQLCLQSEADEVWLMTPSPVKDYPGVSRVFSQVPITETAEIYRSCDVLVKLSYVEGMFGPPLEMFHCGGTSITYDVTGYDEYIVPDENGIVIPTDCETAVVEAINRLKREPERLKQLQEGAARTAGQWYDWPESSENFVRRLEEIMEKESRTDPEEVERLTKFLFQFYVIAEDYRLDLLQRPALWIRMKMRAKRFLKEKHPRMFSFLKGIKLKLTLMRRA